MKEYIQTNIEVFGRYRHLMKNLVHRDISVKYRRSALGWIWSVLNPFLMMLVMTAVFSFIFRQEIEYFPIYLLTGQLVFNFFNEATNMGMDSILVNAQLVKKVYVPKYLFPLEKVMFSFVNTMFSLIALLLVLLFVRPPITPWILLFPLPLVLLFFFNLGVSLILSSLVIFFRDIKHLYGVLVLALTYLTPIFYPEILLPETMRFIIRLNPLYWYVSMFRSLVLYGQGPTLLQLAITIVCAVVVMIVGLIVMKRTQDRFILYI